MTQKLTLTLYDKDGTTLDIWNTDDPENVEVFRLLAKSNEIASLTAAKIRDALNSVYWVKETRTYLIDATSEAEAEEIFNSTDFDEDWANHEVEVGFER